MFGKANSLRNAATLSGCLCVVWIPCRKRSDAIYRLAVGEIGKIHLRVPHLCAALPTENKSRNNRDKNLVIIMDKHLRKNVEAGNWRTECIIPVINESHLDCEKQQLIKLKKSRW